MTLELTYVQMEALEEDDALPDEPVGDRARCVCGRFAQLVSPPETTIMGAVIYMVECSSHGQVAVS